MTSKFRFETDPDDPRWNVWELRASGRFNNMLGPLRVRAEDGKAIVRMIPSSPHSNFNDNVHGGLLMGFIDCAMFAAAQILGSARAEEAVTLECGTQFLSSGRLGVPLDAVMEMPRETGRFIFLRGLLEQDGDIIASFTGILRKPSAPRA